MSSFLTLLSAGYRPRRGGAGGPAYLLRDTFTDADGTPLGSHAMDVGGGWTVHAGTIQIQGGRAVSADTVVGTATADAGQSDAVLSCSGVVVGGGGYYLFVRFASLGNNWLVYTLAGSAVVLYEIVSGSLTQRASGGTVSAGAHDFGVSCVGTTIGVSVDGGQVLEYASATQWQTATRFGLGYDTKTGQTWDDFSVVAP